MSVKTARILGIGVFGALCSLALISVLGLVGVVLFFGIERTSSTAAWITIGILLATAIISLPLMVTWYFFDMKARFEQSLDPKQLSGTMNDLKRSNPPHPPSK